jgi:hypothetical protein
MANIDRIRQATAAGAAAAWTDEDWDELIAGDLSRQASSTGASEAELAWLIQGALAEWKATISAAQKALDRWRAADVADNGPVRFGDTFVRTAPKTTRKIIDQAGLLGWLDHTAKTLGAQEDAADLIAAVWRLDAGNLRISTLRKLAERAYRQAHEDADDDAVAGYVRAIEETFIETTWEEAGTLQDVPIDKAPKYAGKLEHGHRVGTFTNTEEPDDGPA